MTKTQNTPHLAKTRQIQRNPPAQGPGEKYRVVSGDSLWKISEKVLGDGNRWRELHRANPHIVDPDRLWVDDEILLNLVHKAKEGETLPSIAREVLGDEGRWKEIAAANNLDSDKVAADVELRIPIGEGIQKQAKESKQKAKANVEARTPLGKTDFVASPDLPQQQKSQALSVFTNRDKITAESAKTKTARVEAVDATQGEVSPRGVEQAQQFLAMKRACQGVALDDSGKMRLTDNNIDEVAAALDVVAKQHGGRTTVDDEGKIDFAGGQFADPEFKDNIKTGMRRTSVDVKGDIHLSTEGLDKSKIDTIVKHTFGDRAENYVDVEGKTRVTFNGAGLDLEQVEAKIDGRIGNTNIRSELLYDGAVNGTVSLSAFKKLKLLQQQKAIAMVDGQVEIKSNKVSRAEVRALFSDIAGENVNFDSNGRLLYEDGKINAELGAQLQACFDRTELDANFDLALKDGDLSLDADGRVASTFSGGKFNGTGVLEITGFDGRSVDQAKLDVALNSHFGDGKKLDALGMLSYSKGDLEARFSSSFDYNKAKVQADGSFQVGSNSGIEDDRYFQDSVRVLDGGVNIQVPSGDIKALAGGSMASKERVKLSVPKAYQSQLEARTDELSLAMSENNPEGLRQGINGLKLEKTLSKNSGYKFDVGIDRDFGVAGLANAKIAASFFKEMDKDHVVKMDIAYDEDNPNIAEVGISKIDVEKMARNFAISAGIDSSIPEIASALRTHYTKGVSLDGTLGGKALGSVVVDKLQKYVKELKVGYESKRDMHQLGYEELKFSGMDLTKDQDYQAFSQLVKNGDASAAIKAGKMGFHRVYTEEQKNKERAVLLLGHRIGTARSSGMSSDVRTQVVNGQTFELRETKANAQQVVDGFREDTDFQVASGVVSQNGKPIDSLLAVHFGSEDDNYKVSEAGLTERICDALNLHVIKHRKGETDSFLGLGIGKNYGDGSADLSMTVRRPGNRAIVLREPDVAQQNALVTAAKVKGSGVPAGEVFDDPIPTDYLSVALALGKNEQRKAMKHLPTSFSSRHPDVDAKVVQAIAGQSSNVLSEKRLTKARKNLRSAKKSGQELATFFTSMDDARLNALLKRTAASKFLVELRELKNSNEDHSTSTNSAESRLTYDYKRLTGQKASQDMWIVDQGLRVNDIYHRPEMVQARKEGENLGGETAENIVKTIFSDVVPTYLPGSVIGGTTKDEAASVFYGSLLRGLPEDDYSVLVHVKADEYELTAVSDKSDAERVRQMVATD